MQEDVTHHRAETAMKGGLYERYKQLTICPGTQSIVRYYPQNVHKRTHLKYVKADISMKIHVRVIARCLEFYCRRNIRVVGRKRNGNLEGQTGVYLKNVRIWHVMWHADASKTTHCSSSPFNRSNPFEEIRVGFGEGRLCEGSDIEKVVRIQAWKLRTYDAVGCGHLATE